MNRHLNLATVSLEGFFDVRLTDVRWSEVPKRLFERIIGASPLSVMSCFLGVAPFGQRAVTRTVLRHIGAPPAIQLRRQALCGASRAATTTMLLERKTAAAVVIGDEILTGKTQDTNTQTLARFLVRHGVVLKKTETILDDVDTIAETVRRLSATHDLVFTSGGIGPTLDDVTYAGVAAAFGLSLGRHGETEARMRAVRPGMELNEARLRMAELPAPCEALWTEGLWVPLCVAGGNVYVLPGVPRLFEAMLGTVPAGRLGGVRARARAVVLSGRSEGDVAAALLRAKREWPDVAIGSYPSTRDADGQRYRTKLTLEGDDDAEVAGAAAMVATAVDGRLWRGDPDKAHE